MTLIHAGLVVLSISVLALSSCSDEKNPAQHYGSTMVQTYKGAQKFDDTLNVRQVRKSIREFQAANNRYPSDLNELSTFSGLTLKSDNYDYNPATGELTEK